MASSKIIANNESVIAYQEAMIDEVEVHPDIVPKIKRSLQDFRRAKVAHSRRSVAFETSAYDYSNVVSRHEGRRDVVQD